MKSIEKTVFISYYNTNTAHATAVGQHLIAKGYNVFWAESAPESTLLECAHFIPILTPSALDAGALEAIIEQALKHKRNIIPLMLDAADIQEEVDILLDGDLVRLKKITAVSVSPDNFEAAIEHIQERLDTPITVTVQDATEQITLDAVPAATQEQLKAEWVFEKGMAAMLREEHDAALPYFNQAIEGGLKTAVVYTNWANAYLVMGDYDQAIDGYNRALELDPDDTSTYNNRGNAYGGKNDFDRAIIDFGKAIDRDPTSDAAYYNRAATYHRMGDYVRAIEDYTQSIALNPDDAVLYDNRASAYEANGDYDVAIADLNVALKLDRKDSHALNNLGLIYSYQGDYKTALGYFRKAVKIEGKGLASLYNIAVMSIKLWGISGAAKAITAAERVIQQAGESEDVGELSAALYASAGLTAMKGDHNDALDRLEKVIPLHPDAKQWARREVAWNDLRENPRFKALVED